jgi:hypothetical protein
VVHLTDGDSFNVWDVMERWAWALSAQQREAYLAAAASLVEPHRHHHRFKVIHAHLCGRRDIPKGVYPGLDPIRDLEALEVTEDDFLAWRVYWLTHFGEHLAGEECECDRRETPFRGWPDWWVDGDRGERILHAQLECLIVAAGGSTASVTLVRSMMEDWDGDFVGLVMTATRLTFDPRAVAASKRLPSAGDRIALLQQMSEGLRVLRDARQPSR